MHVYRLAAFALVAGSISVGAVSLAESGGSVALFCYAIALPPLGGLVVAVVRVLEDHAEARRAPPRMIALRRLHVRRFVARTVQPPHASMASM